MLQMAMSYTRSDAEIIRETQTRLYEIEGGVESLGQSELLYLILGAGTKTNSLEGIINEILTLKNEYGLKRLTPEYLMANVSGLKKEKAERLLAAIELGRRVYTTEPAVGKTIASPFDAGSIFKYLQHEQQEKFVVAFLNKRQVVIGIKTIFIGTLDSCTVHPREVFHEAVKRSAASVIVAHQHPSGDPTPSREDIDVTKRLLEAGKIMGIDVLDHVIIGFNRFTSLKEKGYL